MVKGVGSSFLTKKAQNKHFEILRFLKKTYILKFTPKIFSFQNQLCGILLYSKNLLYESTLRFVENCKGGKLWGPPKLKKKDLNFWGARNFLPFTFFSILSVQVKRINQSIFNNNYILGVNFKI